MASIRKTKTASGATAVQVVRYVDRRVEVLKHLGSAHDKRSLERLMDQAKVWYTKNCDDNTLFADNYTGPLVREGTEFVGALHRLAYSTLRKVAEHCNLELLGDRLLLDLAIIRLIEPTSKLRSLQLLEEYFDVRHARSTLYKRMEAMVQRKTQVEEIAVGYAKEKLKDGLTMVLYDVTTLYFESFTADELRKPGSSKDNMHQQPQVVVGLLVTRKGFPLGYEVFAGNTFEGKTMLPVLDAFVAKHGVETPTVVADAAMLSNNLLKELQERKMSYIVAARLASSSEEVVEQVCKRKVKRDGRTVRVASPHGDMVCSYSAKRYRKDKVMHEKDIAKAQLLIGKGEPGRRAKFIKGGKKGYVLDEDRVRRAKRLLGIKGYCTNIPKQKLDDRSVIARYHDLWHVEKAFRIAKSDLAARPIFHRAGTAVRTHLLICFAALIMARVIGTRTSLSLRNVIDLLWTVTDATLYHPQTKERITIRSQIALDAQQMLRKF